MSNGDITTNEGNAFVNYRAEQNEREAQHHDEQSCTYSNTNKIYRVVLAVLVGVLIIGATSAVQTVRHYQTEDNARLDRRTVAKLFYQAVSNDLAGRPDQFVEYPLNKMYDFDYAKLIKLHDPKFLQLANELNAVRVAEGIQKRTDLLFGRGSFDTLQQLTKALKKNPEAWDRFIKIQD
jgi:hypothetical protein